MSRHRSRSVSRPAPSTSSDNSAESSSKPPCDRPSPEAVQTTYARRHSFASVARPNASSGEYQAMCRPPSRGSEMESRGRSATRVPSEQSRGRSSSRGAPEAHRGRSATRPASQSEPQGRGGAPQEKPRGRSVTRAVRRSPEQSGQGPMRSASCARAQDRRNSTAVSDRLGDVQLRQSVEDLRRSLHDLSSTLGFQNPSSTTMEALHRRMEADYEQMRRRTNECEDTRRYSDEDEDDEEELLQIGPKTAVVPPFSHSPPPPRSETPSRIPVPRSHSPRPPPAPTSKFQRSHSVCTDMGMCGKRDALSRRNSTCDVKITTPLVTGRSSFISTGRAPSGNRCFRPSRSQKQSG